MSPRSFLSKPAAVRLARRCAVVALLVALAPASSLADTRQDIAELRREISELRREYEDRLGALEERLARLETGGVEAGAEATPEAAAAGDLAALRAAAREAVAPDPEAAIPAGPAVGRERNLNRLNPEISFTGIFLGSASDAEREEFELESFELDLQSALDPFSRSRVVLGVHEGEIEIEEAWVNYSSLPGGLDLLAGRFRQRFGALNRQHLHALPQSDYPLAHQAFFGEEGLAQTGLSFTWLLPRPWASANEITLEVTDGENEEAFGGELFEDLAVLARLKNFWELSDAAYFEWGLSGIAGRTELGGDSRVLGTDFTYSWQPPARAKYRSLSWRAEILRSRRDDPDGVRREAWGGYTYLEALLRQNLYGGLRLDRVEDPLAPSRRLRGLVPYLSWWQSEWVRLRAELAVLEDELSGDDDTRFTLQLTWAAGPHKHETY